MTYLELRNMILDESHRADLVARVPSFVKRAEAMIARDVRAVETHFHATLVDGDRLATDSPIYVLPSDFLEDRAVIVDGKALRKVGHDALLSFRVQAPPTIYHLRGSVDDAWLEVRGNTGTGSAVEIDYFGRLAALADDADTNRLLTNHESVYLHASLFALYMWTQDLELAQGALDTWTNAVERLNELAGRYFGGTGLSPTVNLGHYPVGRGY